MKARTSTSDPRQRGFSMVELMVAMTVTLIVSGAIYGLLTSGGNAFRREPEMADRQQNIRIAMDAIARDVEGAGGGAPLVGQIFTHTDAPLAGPAPTGVGAPYLNGAGPQGVMGVPGRALRGAAPSGAGADPSDNSDILEIVTGEAACPAYRVCTNTAPAPPSLNGTAEAITTREFIPVSDCLLTPGNPGSQGLVLITNNMLFTIQPATLNPAGAACGGAAGTNGSMALGAALPEWQAVVGVASQPLLYRAKVVRYVLAPGLDPTDTAPALWRSETGRYTAAGAASALPAAGATNWQIIARGIEDLQLEYLNGGTNGSNGLWANNPGVIPPCAAGGCTAVDYRAVIRRVRVTLSARALVANLQGQTVPAGGAGPNALRGQLVSVITPRAAVMGLTSSTASPVSGWQ